MMLPKGIRVSSPFGERIHPVTKQKQFHNGIDIVMPVGTSILAPMCGKVIDVYENAIGGLQLIFECAAEGGERYTFGFAHLSRVVAIKGNYYNEGDIIAYSGNTGRSTGAHLHFTVRLNGNLIDPMIIYEKFKKSVV